VVTIRNNEDPLRSAEPVSPELALVDPVLAERARLALPDRPEFPPVRRTAEPPTAPPVAVTAELPAAPVPSRGDMPRSRARQVRRRSGAAFGLIAAAALGGLASALVTADFSEPASRATSVAPAQVAAAEPGEATTRAARPIAPTAGQERVFAWAPVAKARAYEFQLFRGETLVYRMRVSDSRLTLPPQWRLEGRPQTARPGSYRWYVWPIVAGRTQPVKRATVQATFVID
jgi:hypothetical protein